MCVVGIFVCVEIAHWQTCTRSKHAKHSKVFFRFMDKLQNDYAESEEVLMGWEENSFCAARMTQEQRWHRAKIQSTPDEDRVQVLAIDFGYQAIIFILYCF